jgi:flagellar basal-body rod protein FlgB
MIRPNGKRRRRSDSMDLFNIALFHRISERMNWLGAREKVIATNIANSDTPSYQPKDVLPLDFGDHLKKLTAVEPGRTDPKHMSGTVPPADPVDSKKQRKTYETAPAGNSVVIEEQMMKLSQTQADYNQMVNLYRKHVDMLKTAIGRGA